MRNGFPANYLDPSNIVLSRLLIRAANPSGENASFDQFSIGTERQLGRRFAVSADFVGNFGRDIAVLRNLNQPLNGNGPRPFPDFAHIQWRDPVGTSRYYGLELSAEKRFGDGLSYRVGYTVSDARIRRPSISRRARVVRRTRTTSRPGKVRATSTCVTSGRELRRRAAVRLRKAVVNNGVGGRSARRLDGQWHLHCTVGRPFTVTQGSLEGRHGCRI